MGLSSFQIGLISDTHGLLRPEAVAALAGSDHIIHAGDIGDPAIIAALEAIAPVTAVRGNNDRGPWAEALAETQLVDICGVRLHVLHILADLDLDPVAAGIRAVVCGHSHRPAITAKDGVLFVNPGSAGPRRFSLPVAVGRLRIAGAQVEAQILELPVPMAKAAGGARRA